MGKIDETKDYATNDNPLVFKFQGYFGFNPVNPLQNYAYFRASGKDMTVKNFCEAFDIPIPSTAPEPLLKSGFYGEQILSYSYNGE